MKKINKTALLLVAAMVIGGAVYVSTALAGTCSTGYSSNWTDTISCSVDGHTGTSFGEGSSDPRTLNVWFDGHTSGDPMPYARATGYTSTGSTVCNVYLYGRPSAKTTRCKSTAVKHKLYVWHP